MSHDFQKEIAWLGAISSPAFVRAPEGNGCAERFIRTLKENLLWVRTFRTVEELRLALIEFRQTYNEHWLIGRHGHRSPAQFRRDQMDAMPLAAQSQTGVSVSGGGTAEPFAVEVVQHVQQPELMASGQPVGHEVHRPDQVRGLGNGKFLRLLSLLPPALLEPQVQLQLSVDPVDALMVPGMALAIPQVQKAQTKAPGLL
jgi:hypothetical protein